MGVIGIYGSCTTRDVVELVRDRFEIGYYVARASLLSTFGPQAQIEGLETFDFKVADKAAFEERQVVNDVFKRNAGIVSRPVDVFVYDGIDERFALLEGAGGCATYSNYLELSPARDRLLPLMPRSRPDPVADRDRWRRACDALVAAVDARVLVIHEAFWADRHRDPEGEIHIFGPADLELVKRENDRLEAIYALLKEAAPEAVSVRAPRELIFSDFVHKWGRDFFHYGPEYYAAVAAQLGELVAPAAAAASA